MSDFVILKTTGAGILRNRCAFTPRDMGADWPEAFTYAVVSGWDDPDVHSESAMDEMAARWGWDEPLIEFLRDAHRRFQALPDRRGSAPRDRRRPTAATDRDTATGTTRTNDTTED